MSGLLSSKTSRKSETRSRFALNALGGRTAEPEKKTRGRSTKVEVERRRDMLVSLLENDPELSISELAEQLGVGYQTAANDIRLLKANGTLPE